MDQPASVPRGRSLSEGAPHLPVPDTEAVSTHGPRGAGHMSWAGHNPDTQAPLGVTWPGSLCLGTGVTHMAASFV